MIVYVTGSSGFLGTYICDILCLSGFSVFRSTKKLDDFNGLVSELKNSRANYVLHLAACSYVAHENTNDFYTTNLLGTKNLIEAISLSLPNLTKLIITSSAAVYGNVSSSILSEDIIPSPTNDYGISKFAMEMVCRQWFSKIPILIVRPFNFTGIGQSTKFIIPKIVEHFKNKSPEITLGNTSTYREYNDVRDVASYYLSLMRSEKHSDVLNICNGISISIQEVLELCRDISKHQLVVTSDPKLYRFGEINKLCGSTDKMLNVYTLKPKFNLSDTIYWMLKSN